MAVLLRSGLIIDFCHGCWQLRDLRIARWLVTLSGFEFTLEYKPEKENLSADALFRFPTQKDGDYKEPVIVNDLVLNLMVFGDLLPAKNQREDKNLVWVFDNLEEKIEYPMSKKK